MNQISLDAGELKTFLHYTITNNRELQKNQLTPTAVEIMGPSGLGKTSISLQVANEFGLAHIKLNLAQIEELGDLVGFPVRQFEMAKPAGNAAPTGTPKMERVKQPDGTFKFVQVTTAPAGGIDPATKIMVDEVAVDTYVKQGYVFTGEKRQGYCPPEWIAGKEDGGILILDDWTRGDTRFLQAVMDLIDRQEYISWKLPKDWHILLTANPDDGNYLVNAIDVAQKTRFSSVDLKWSAERWAEWAEKNGIDSRCINFVLMSPEMVDDRVNPRSLTNFFNSIYSIKDFEEELPLIKMLGEGTVGPEAATMFVMFINNKLDKLISPKDVLLHDSNKWVKEQLLESFKSSVGDFKASVASIMTTRIVNYAVHYSQSHTITDEILDRIKFLAKTDDLFTDDLKYILVKKIFNGNKQKFQKLLADEEMQDLATK